MAKRERRFVALLRGVNVGGHDQLPMAELRAALAALPLRQVGTYIQSGNVVFVSALGASAIERHLAGTLREHFGLQVPIVVRDGDQWHALIDGNPFAEQAQGAPNRVQVGVAKQPLAADAAIQLQALASRGELVLAADQALWLHYPAGIAETKLTPARLDRCAGSSVTTRNWRTVLKLQAMILSLAVT
ncbi:MAG: DUF1697 domain-containing protein [Pseudomonadota bacterium]